MLKGVVKHVNAIYRSIVCIFLLYSLIHVLKLNVIIPILISDFWRVMVNSAIIIEMVYV